MPQSKTIRRGLTKTRLKWFGQEIRGSIRDGMKTRLGIAGAALRDQIMENISTAVRKQGRTVVERSKPGEFPRADLGKLRQDVGRSLIVTDVEASVGTHLGYGVILETSPRLDRSFLVRTLNEEAPKLLAILTAPMKLKGG